MEDVYKKKTKRKMKALQKKVDDLECRMKKMEYANDVIIDNILDIKKEIKTGIIIMPESEKEGDDKEKKKDEKGSSAASAAAPSNAIANKPGEPDFKLELKPDVVLFEYKGDKKAVWCDVKIINGTKDRHTFKVKCTSGDLFRVQPPIGFVKPEDSTSIRFWFQNKTPVDQTKHYFAVYHMKCAEGKNVKEMWTKTSKPEGLKRISATFKSLDAK